VCEAEPIHFDGGEIRMSYHEGDVSLAVLGTNSEWHGIDHLPREQAQTLMLGLAYMLARDTDPATGVAA